MISTELICNRQRTAETLYVISEFTQHSRFSMLNGMTNAMANNRLAACYLIGKFICSTPNIHTHTLTVRHTQTLNVALVFRIRWHKRSSGLIFTLNCLRLLLEKWCEAFQCFNKSNGNHSGMQTSIILQHCSCDLLLWPILNIEFSIGIWADLYGRVDDRLFAYRSVAWAMVRLHHGWTGIRYLHWITTYALGML